MKIKESASTEAFEKFEDIISKYMPVSGEGKTKASQLVTAVNKIIYKWFNDGDVVDNVNTGLEGGLNDLSSYANWLWMFIPEAKEPLHNLLYKVHGDEYEYTLYLYQLADLVLKEDVLEKYSSSEPIGSIYKNDPDGPFEWEEPSEDDEDNDYEEEEDDSEENEEW